MANPSIRSSRIASKGLRCIVAGSIFLAGPVFGDDAHIGLTDGQPVASPEGLQELHHHYALEALAEKFIDRLRPAYGLSSIDGSQSSLPRDSMIPPGEELLLRVLVDKWSLSEDLLGITD